MAAVTTIAISQCVGVGTTGTYTCVITGPNLVAGMPVLIQGFVAHTTFNSPIPGNFIIQTATGNPTTSFTCTITSTTATEVIAATGSFDPEGIQSTPTADTPNPLGFGINRITIPPFDPYGNFTPGTLPGSQQTIAV